MKRSKQVLSFCLAALLAGTLGLPMGALAATGKSFSDTRGHWAKDYIQSGVSRGYISGYENGTFKPDNPVTRAEFCKMANNALGVTQTASIGFSDVSSADWYYSEVRRAVAAGYISGYEDNTFRPNANITRQEAAVVLSRVVTPPDADRSIYEFRDSGGIDAWAQNGAGTVYAKNYMAGDDNQNFRPRGNLTRAESAKIVEMLLKGESVVKSDVTVTSPQTLSKGLYLGNVTLTSGVGNGDVTLRNCRILGTLTVNGGDEITLTHSGVNNLVVNRTGGEPTINASGNSIVRKTTVNSGCQLTESGPAANGFVDVTLSGGNLKNADVSLKGTYDNVTVNSPSRLSLTSGAITNLTLSSGAAGSQVNLASNTRVTLANIAGSADFTGTGRITRATITASNVTFETPPDDGSGYQAMTPVVTPKHGASEVAVSTKITLVFQETIKTDDNRDLTRSYVENEVVELRAGRENGTKVSVTAALSNSNRTITLTPDESLDRSTTYYIILLKNSLRNTAGTYNARQVFSFSTVGGLTPVTNPVDGSDTIPVGTNITLTFGDALVRGDDYSSLSSSYLNNSCFDMTWGSAGGKSVSFTASISSDRKTITIDPVYDLETSTRYYVTIRKNSLANSGRTAVKEQTFSFTTVGSSVLAPTMDPPTGSAEVDIRPTLSLTFNEQLYTYDGGSSLSGSYLTDCFTLYRNSNTSSNRVGLDISINSARRVITITPQENLRANTTYYLELKRNSFSDRATSSGRNSNIAMTFSFTTGSESTTGTLTPTIMPKNGATDVATTAGPIQLTFDSSIYNSSGGGLTSSYLRNTVLELREGSATGNTVTCSASVDGRVITLTPSGNLRSNTRYYVIVNPDTLRNSSSSTSGKTNSKFTSYFTTGSSSTALQASSPHNGATNVSPTDSVVLTYGEGIYTSANDSLSSIYIRSAVKLYEGTSEGSNAVSFASGTVTNSNRTLTLTPPTLKDNTTYLVVIPAGSFTNASGVPNTKQSFIFNVGNGISIAMTTPTNNATGVSRTDPIVLTFGEAVKRSNGVDPDAAYLANNIYLYQGSASGTKVTALSYTLSNRTITLTPTTALSAGAKYYVVIPAGAFTGATRGSNARFEANFTTTSAVIKAAVTSSTPGQGATVPFTGAGDVTLTFNSDLTGGATGGAVDQGYLDTLKTEGKLTFKADSTPVSFAVRMSGTRALILTPASPLRPSSSYTVGIAAGVFQSGSLGAESRNDAYTLSFATGAPAVNLQLEAGKTSLNAVASYDYAPEMLKLELKEKAGTDWKNLYEMQPEGLSYTVSENGLTEGTEYSVRVTYTYGGGKIITQEKTITTERTSEDAELKTLEVYIPGMGTSPSTPENKAYDDIPVGTAVEIRFTHHAKAKAQVTVGGAVQAAENGALTVSSDTAGTKVITITVTAENGVAVKTYTVTLTWVSPAPGP